MGMESEETDEENSNIEDDSMMETIKGYMPDLWFYDQGSREIKQYDKDSLVIEVVGSNLVIRDNETGQVVGQGKRYFGIDSLEEKRVRWYVVTDQAEVKLGQTTVPLTLMSEMGEDAYRENGLVVSASPPVVPFFNNPGEMFVNYDGYAPSTQIRLSNNEFELINGRSGEEHMIMTLIEYGCMVNGLDFDETFSSIRNGKDVVMSVFGVDWHVSEGFVFKWTSTIGDDAFVYSSFGSENGALVVTGSIASSRSEDGGFAELGFRFRGPEILAIYEFVDRSHKEATDVVLFMYRRLVGYSDSDSDSGFLFVAPIGQAPIPFN